MDETTRWSTIARWLRAPRTEDLDEIRGLTRATIAARRASPEDGCGDDLYALCFLLYLVGEPEDVVLIDDAKHLNMDTGCMIDRFLLTMRRDRRTMLGAVAAVAADADRPWLERDVTAAFDAPHDGDPATFERALYAYFDP
ncbi:MAG: hypothetical protein IT374_02510 [Polyangiaceae bacterium]|nr:hypothetical protein [Polyangiaceae bacterium]